MNEIRIENLGQLAADMAIRAAILYLREKGLQAEPTVLCKRLKVHTAAKLPEAMRDAKEAYDARMYSASEMTFRASMVLAGIAAAKEAGFPPGVIPNGADVVP